MLWDPRDRNLYGGPASQPPTLPDLPEEGAIGEMVARFDAEWGSARARLRTNSGDLMRGDALQPFLDAYERETGEELENPYSDALILGGQSIPGPGPELKVFDERKAATLERARQKYEAAREQPGDRLVSRLPQWPTEEQLRQSAIARGQNAAERAERAAALSSSAAGTVGGFAGTTASLMADPVNVASLFLGAPAGAGILRTMAVETAVGAGAEAATKPQVLAWQRELGEDPSVGQVALDVATAGVGSGIFAGLFKGGSAIWQRVRPHLTRDQRAAIHVTEAMDVIDRRNPFEIAKRARLRAERTGQAPSATFADELRASASDDLAFTVELDRLARELDETIAAAHRDLDEAAAARGATVERTEAGDQLVVPGAERISDRALIERRMAASDVRTGQEGLAGLELFDPTSRARQADLLDVRARDPIEQQAVHTRAVQEAEASLEAGQAPDGPAIQAIDEAFPNLELPVWQARTGKGKTTRWRGPMDIVTWARTVGGLRDSGGELKARDLQLHNRGRPGVELAKGEVFLGKLVNNEDGIDLDEAALRAWEAGYFPGHADRPTPDDLLEAIDRTIAAGSGVDGRVWSEQDAELVEQLRGRVDPDEEAHYREIMGDEWVDDAIDAIDGMPVVEEPISPELDAMMRARTEAPDDTGEAPTIATEDEAELMTLEALQEQLEAGDFRVTQEVTEDGEPVSVSRSAREVWQETEAETAGMRDAAACMVGGAANAA